jgi:hypothetical protein
MSQATLRRRRTGRSVILAAVLALPLSAVSGTLWAGAAHADGKPCDGCVGKADVKAPPGQDAYGADSNAGYECDTNHGVGRGNPAHTACFSGA